MPIPVASIVRSTYYSTVAGQRILNVLHWRVAETASSGTVLADLTAIASRLADETLANSPLQALQTLMANNTSINYVRVQVVSPEPSIYVQYGINVNGLYAEASNLPNAALSISKRTLTMGRHGVGRVQIAGVPAGGYVNGKFFGPYFDLAEIYRSNFSASVAVITPAITLIPVLFHGPAGPTAWSDIITTVAHDEVRTMHRRTVGLGI